MSRFTVSTAPAVIPPLRVLAWCTDALRLWWRAPFRLWLLSLLPLIGEGLLQAFVPEVGMVLSKLVAGLLTGGVLWALHQAACEGRAPLSSVVDVFRQGRARGVLAMAAMTWLVLALQVAVAMAVYGSAVFDAVVLGHMAAHPELQVRAFPLLLILPGLLPMIWLSLAWAYLLFDGLRFGAALRAGWSALWGHAVAIGLWLLLNGVLFALMLSTRVGLLLMLVLPIWSVAGTYLVYRDASGNPWCWPRALAGEA